jgi:hypothetical protein
MFGPLTSGNRRKYVVLHLQFCYKALGQFAVIRGLLKYLLRTYFIAGLAVIITPAMAWAEDQSKCDSGPHLLWGDGEHDDTAALNAWFRGERVTWAQTHEAVGDEIADRAFLLSSTVYVSGGTGRRLERFRMMWPWRNEVVSGGAIVTGNDPEEEPRTESITMVGADPDEGVPYKTPDDEPREHGIPRRCLTS